MNSHSNQNEGFRILEEFVCQAIPDPSVLASSRQPAATGMEHELEVTGTNPESLSATLVGEDGRLKDRIEIGNGLALCPLFTSLRRSGPVGGSETLAFILHIPVGIAIDLVAAAIYDWMTRHEVRRARADGVEVTVSGTPTEDVPALAQALGQKATGGGPNGPR